MNDIPHFSPNRCVDAHSECGVEVGPHMVRLAGDDVLINDGSGLHVGVVNQGTSRAVHVTVFRRAGGKPHGMGLIYTMTAQEARDAAGALIANATTLEAEADAQAAAALARAAGKGAA